MDEGDGLSKFGAFVVISCVFVVLVVFVVISCGAVVFVVFGVIS
jgi:hypothetical protein